MAEITPHFAWPFRFVGGVAAVDDQGTLAEVEACVTRVVTCFIGDCPDVPDLGIPNPLFAQAPIDPTAITAACNLWEPRATVTVGEGADPSDPTGATRIVTIEVELS
jgi:hypothetical protein